MLRSKNINTTARAVFTSCLVATTFIFVPAANATPVAETEAFQLAEQQQVVDTLVAAEMAKTQTVIVPANADDNVDLAAAREGISATTREELDVIRAEQARVAAEAEAARQAEAARVAAEAEAARQAQAAEAARQAEAAAAAQAAQAVRYPSQATVNNNAAGAYQPGGAASTNVPLSSGSKSSIASAALAQIGEKQDCTRLVADAIAAAGYRYTGMANLGSIGTPTTLANAQPGDILYYANGGTGRAHVAIYIGGGKAVHGGWGGNNTVVAGATLAGASTPVVYSL